MRAWETSKAGWAGLPPFLPVPPGPTYLELERHSEHDRPWSEDLRRRHELLERLCDVRRRITERCRLSPVADAPHRRGVRQVVEVHSAFHGPVVGKSEQLAEAYVDLVERLQPSVAERFQ